MPLSHLLLTENDVEATNVTVHLISAFGLGGGGK